MEDDAKLAVSEKIADLEARIADADADGGRINADMAKAMAQATGAPEPSSTAPTLPELLGVPPGGPLQPREVRNHGPVAGTGVDPGIPGVKATDLGEIVTLPNGKHVAIFGDSYGQPEVSGKGNPHYSSVAVPVTFDRNGHPHFGAPLNGTNPDSGFRSESQAPNALFPLPSKARDAGANNTLPAGSVVRDGRTYMMVVGTNTNAADPLKPVGSWLVEVNNNPGGGWRAIENDSQGRPIDTYRPVGSSSAPTQVSGYQGSDGKVYIAADGFDRSQGVSMYRVDPDHLTDRGAWQPYNPTDNTWGSAGQPATTITPERQNWGEISFREVDGHPVLSGTNFNQDTTGVPTVEVRVGDTPTGVLDPSRPPVVVMNNAPGALNNVPAPYGGYILPGSTLDNLGIFGSQWWQPDNGPLHYDVQHIQANVTPTHR